MSIIRAFTKFAVVIVCTGSSFGSVVGFMAAQSEAAPLTISSTDSIAVKLAEDSDLTGKMREMSPIYPTTKYTHAQLSVSSVKKAIKSKVATRPANKMPMQIAYNPQVAAQAGVAFAHIR